MTTWCLIPNLIFYCLASLFYLSVIFGSRRLWLTQTAFLLTVFGAVLHLIYLAYLSFQLEFLVLSFVSFGLILLFLFLAKFKSWDGLGAIFVPFGFILWFFSLGEGVNSTLFKGLTWFVFLHVFLAVLTFIFMLANLGLGFAFLFHERNLKQKKWEALAMAMPPLWLNKKLAFHLLRFGFALLTLVLVSGALLAWKGSGVHIVFAFLAWLFYFFILMRGRENLQGRKIVLLSLLGFVSLAAAYLWIS